MANTSVKIKSLEITELPGLPKGLDASLYQNLDADILLIKGPNASGKSSTIRAMQQVLWPGKETESNLSAEFVVNGDKWRVKRNFTQLIIEKNGERISEAPTQNKFAERYNLSMNDLLIEDEYDLAKKVQEEIFGGISPEEVVKSEAYENKISRTGKNEVIEYKNALDSVEKLQNQQLQLVGKEHEIEKLEKEKEAYELEANRQLLIDHAISVIQLQKEVKTLKSKVDTYNPLVSKLADFSPNDVKEYEEERKNREHEIRDYEIAIEGVKKEINQLELTHHDMDAVTLNTLEELKSSISQLEIECENREENARAAHRQLIEISKKFNYKEGDIEEWKYYRSLEKFSFADANNLGQFLEEFHVAAMRLKSYQAETKLISEGLSTEEETPGETEIEKRIYILSEWLKTQSDKKKIQPLAFIIYVAIILLAIVLFYPLISTENLVYISVIFIALSTLFYFLAIFFNNDGKKNIAELNSLGMSVEDWTIENIYSEIDNLLAKKSDLNRNQLLNHRIQQLEIKSEDLMEEVSIKQSTLRGYKTNIAEQLNLNIDSIETQVLKNYFDSIRKWQECNTRYVTAKNNSYEKRNEQLNKIAKFNEKLKNTELHSCTTVEEIKATYRRIKELYETSSELHSKLETTELNLQKEKRELNRVNSKISDAYHKIGKTEEDRNIILSLYNEYDTFKQDKYNLGLAVNNLQIKEQEYQQELKKVETEEDLLQVPEETLLERKERAVIARDKREKLVDKISEINAEINQARQSARLQEALKILEESRDALEELYLDDLRKNIGALLIANIQTQEREENQPNVLKRANEILLLITNGRYELKLSRNSKNPSFLGYDTIREMTFPLNKLSSGTRIHLLMALRLASIEESEKGGLNWKMPLFADELLANTDDDRVEEVINILTEIAGTGRQIFYFTAQNDEIVKWEKHLRKLNNEIRYKVIELEESSKTDIPQKEQAELFPEIKLELHVKIPAPEGVNKAAYRKKLIQAGVNIPPFNRESDTVSGQHLFYFIDDAEDLHYLLTGKVVTWAQLETLAGNNDDYEALISKYKITEKADLLRKYRELYAIGRAKMVNRKILLDNGVTKGKIDAVVELLKECEYDTQKLINEITTIDGIGDGTQKAVKFNLIESGYLPEEEPLAPIELERQLLAYLKGKDLTPEEAHAFLNQV